MRIIPFIITLIKPIEYKIAIISIYYSHTCCPWDLFSIGFYNDSILYEHRIQICIFGKYFTLYCKVKKRDEK
jgi:hypothetical protein